MSDLERLLQTGDVVATREGEGGRIFVDISDGTRQVEALDLLHEVGEALCVQADFEPGDMQFFNNHVIYHGRGAFEDDEAGHDRLLLRLWLSMPDSRPLPKGHAVLWGATEAGALRGGIAQPG